MTNSRCIGEFPDNAVGDQRLPLRIVLDQRLEMPLQRSEAIANGSFQRIRRGRGLFPWEKALWEDLRKHRFPTNAETGCCWFPATLLMHHFTALKSSSLQELEV